MTLGDIFGKLSGIPLMSILKWYGRVVFFTLIAGAMILAVFGVVILAWAIVVTVPWPLLFGIIVGISGFIAMKIADPDFFKDDRDRELDALKAGDLSVSNARRKVVSDAKIFNNWQQIREVVEMMTDSQGCKIVWDDEERYFSTRQEALDFLDGKKSL